MKVKLLKKVRKNVKLFKRNDTYMVWNYYLMYSRKEYYIFEEAALYRYYELCLMFARINFTRKFKKQIR